MTTVYNSFAELLDDARKDLDAQPIFDTEVNSQEDKQPVKLVDDYRQIEIAKARPTALQLRYQRQLRTSRNSNPKFSAEMAKYIAWTWIPGRDRKSCPPIVDLRDSRLVTMDRYLTEPHSRTFKVGLALHRALVNRFGVVCHANPMTYELFKDFSMRPHTNAGGFCLDARNEDVLRTALALDYAIELAVRNKVETQATFNPPPTLFGFPMRYVPSPEWQKPMQDAIIKALHPDSPLLKCFLSPGGLVTGVVETHDGFKNINIEKDGKLIQVRIPMWTVMLPASQPNTITTEGQPLADLHRGDFARIKDINTRYPFKALEWLEHRILEESTETITVEEDIFDKQLGERKMVSNEWRCVPSQFVQKQIGRAARFFLDLRGYLGRKEHTLSLSGEDVWTEDPHQVRIDVCKFPECPNVDNSQFDDGVDGNGYTWYADLLAPPGNETWASRCGLRGSLGQTIDAPQLSLAA